MTLMLDPAELDETAATFAVAPAQVRRDHVISHLLAALSEHAADAVMFFGGTALARTHLPGGRLSEDVDLLAVGSRRAVVANVESVLGAAARRAVGALQWERPLSSVREIEHGLLRAPDGAVIRVQLLDPLGYPDWPTERRPMEQRYSDAPPASLTVPTRDAFVAWKTATWAERYAARDLFDLAGLAGIGAIGPAAADLYVRYGPTGTPPQGWLFGGSVDEARWVRELAGQTRLVTTAAESLLSVRAAWEAALV
jgi:hypothetical protein